MSDQELEALKERRLKEMERRLRATLQERPPPPPPEVEEDPWETVSRHLAGRGQEVLEAARAQYPKAAELVVKQIAKLIRAGKLERPIDGEEFFEALRLLGIPVRLPTRIVYESHGRVKSFAEKLAEASRAAE